MGFVEEKNSGVHICTICIIICETNLWSLLKLKFLTCLGVQWHWHTNTIWHRCSIGTLSHCLLPGVTGSPQSQCWDSPTDQQHWQMESLISTYLRVYNCVNKNVSNKNDRRAMFMFSFSFLLQLANETALLTVLLLPSVLDLFILFSAEGHRPLLWVWTMISI